MKTSILISFILIIIFFAGCSNDNLVSNNSNSSNGSISLNINKSTAPSNVVAVIAYLTRDNFDTLTGSLNLFSDSTADISFQSIAAGTWHLKVDALNKDSVVIYTGESDIKVQENVLTQISLTLYPTGNRTGDVYIYVTWGKQNKWIDYNDNPIFHTYDNPSGPNAVMEPKVYYDNGIYKMWYSCMYNSAKFNVWYAESPDGIHWQNKFNNPVFVNDTSGFWDDYTVLCGAIIKGSDNQFLMYYNGDNSQYGPWQIGLATSMDGVHWNRFVSPIISADDNNYWLGVISVLNANGKYYMYYTSAPKNNRNMVRIFLATSIDCINWTKYSNNPILGPTEGWEGEGIMYPAVIYDNNHFIMIYSSTDRTKFGIAYSDNGINWNKSSAPTFTVEDTNQDLEQINYPYLIKVENEYRLYYNGTTLDNSRMINFAYILNLN